MERADFEQWKPKEVARLLALVETERRYYQEIVANLPLSLAIVSADGKVLSSNRHFRQTLGKKNDEVMGLPIGEVANLKGLAEVAQQVVRTGTAAPQLDSTWDLGDRSLDVRVVAQPLRNWEEDSDSEALLVLFERGKDASEEPVLTLRDQKSLAVSEDVGAMLWEADLSTGKITHVNGRAETLFGYPEAAWLENEGLWSERVAEDDRERVKRFYQSLGQSEASELTIEFMGRRADASGFAVRESVRIIRGEGGKALRLVGCTSDVTARREVEDQHSLHVKSEALYRLSAKLAHDLNNLLMIIAGYGEELKNALPSSNPLHNDMRQILEATERLYTLTTQLQTYTRRPIVSAVSTQLEAMLGAMRERLAGALGEGITLETQFAEGLGKAKADTAQIEQALLGICQHLRLEMGGEGQVRILVAPHAATESVGQSSGMDFGDYVRMSLTHSGSPMSKEAKERLLEPWLYSEDSIRELKMGLAWAYQILRQSGGDLRVDGRTYHAYLPALSQAEREAERTAAIAAEAAAAVTAAAPPLNLPTDAETTLETILIVEDEGGIRALVRKILRRQGYHVLEASNGEEALDVLREHAGTIDLLLTDVMMPGMNGVDLSYRAVEVQPAIRVLFVSGYTDESLLEAGRFPQGTAFLQKPFTLGGLLGKVREVLDAGLSKRASQ